MSLELLSITVSLCLKLKITSPYFLFAFDKLRSAHLSSSQPSFTPAIATILRLPEV